VTSEALVCDIHVSKANELLGGGLNASPALGDPDSVSEDESDDSVGGNGQSGSLSR
jgi:hypothetical protein